MNPKHGIGAEHDINLGIGKQGAPPRSNPQNLKMPLGQGPQASSNDQVTPLVFSTSRRVAETTPSGARSRAPPTRYMMSSP